MPTATVSDVTDVIATSLSDSDIQASIDYAAERNADAYDTSNQSTVQTKNIERWLAVINIRESKDPAVEEDSVGDSATVYAGDELAHARSQLSQWEPGTTLSSTVVRDTNRHVTSTDMDG